MEFEILGPLRVRADDGQLIALPGAKPRALLAMLLLAPNQAISAERLAVGLWGEDAPEGATATVRVHVSRLRRSLGAAAPLETTAAGYRLRVAPGELDAERFEDKLTTGRGELAAGRVEPARSVLREALALWRGPALDDLAGRAVRGAGDRAPGGAAPDRARGARRGRPRGRSARGADRRAPAARLRASLA